MNTQQKLDSFLLRCQAIEEMMELVSPHIEVASRLARNMDLVCEPYDSERRKYIVTQDFYNKARAQGFDKLYGLKLVPLREDE